MPEISRLSHKHQDLLDFLMANPTMKLGDVAHIYGVTPAWLSCIIHSDCFQDKLAQRQDQVFAEAIVPISSRLTALGHLALERLTEKIEVEQDTEVIRKTSETVLKALKFTADPEVPPPTVQNTYVVNQTVLTSARERVGSRTFDHDKLETTNIPERRGIEISESPEGESNASSQPLLSEENDRPNSDKLFTPAQTLPASGDSGMGQNFTGPSAIPKVEEEAWETAPGD